MITALDQFKLLGRSGLRVSPLCLGTMTFGTELGWGADEATSQAIFDSYVDQGGNFIDTAIGYTLGTSEKYIGKFIQGRRDRLVLATKFSVNFRPGDPNAGGNHRKAIVQSLEESLRRMNTDYIDLYWLHMWEGRTPLEETMRALDDLVRAGKVLYLGVSDTPAWVASRAQTLAELRGWTSFVALQAEYSLVERTAERDLIPMARACGLGVMPWSPLGGGVLAGKYSENDLAPAGDAEQSTRRAWLQRDSRLTRAHIDTADLVKTVAKEIDATPAQVAIAWIVAQPGVTSTIIGARSKAHLEDNLAALRISLSNEQLQRLTEATAISLGFPRSFIDGPGVKGMISGGSAIEYRGLIV